MHQLQATTTKPMSTSAHDGLGPVDRIGNSPSKMHNPPSSKRHPAHQSPKCRDICLAVEMIIDESVKDLFNALNLLAQHMPPCQLQVTLKRSFTSFSRKTAPLGTENRSMVIGSGVVPVLSARPP